MVLEEYKDSIKVLKIMYPLLLKPPIKDYLWGGTKLKTDFGFETKKKIAAEAWMLSAHKDGMNIVLNGEHKGKTLNDVLEIWGESALGSNAEKFSYFPILIKLIDAKQKLSVQVHPNDEYALSVEGEYGKTEMWYVVEAEKNAKITFGVKEEIDKARLEKEIQNKSVENVLNAVKSKGGDVFFVEAGTIHAIGKGNIIAEIQQNSNVTYRLYDYGRKGKDGKERELHIEKGVKSANCKKINARKIPICSDGTRLLGSCEYFAVKKIKLKGNKTFNADEKSYHALVVTEGNAELLCDGYKEELSVGQGR